MSATTFRIKHVDLGTVQYWVVIADSARRAPRPVGPRFLDWGNARDWARKHGLVAQMDSAVLAGAIR